MNIIPSNPAFEVSSIGEAAFEFLSNSRSGEVVAAVSGAVYLRTDRKELFWLIPGTADMHRRCLKVDTGLPRMNAGDAYHVSGHQLHIGSGIFLDFDRSRVWASPSIFRENGVAMAVLPGLVAEIYTRIAGWPEPAGLGCLVPAMLNRLDPAIDPGDIFSVKAWPVIREIVLACQQRDIRKVMLTSTDLVGLGDGLTPSGDDFLGGLFFCLHLLQQAYPTELALLNCNHSYFIYKCEPMTNPISYALLKDHARGQGLEPLHRFAKALFEGHPVDQILPHANDLSRVGHSTGWNILAGFMAGLMVTNSC